MLSGFLPGLSGFLVFRRKWDAVDSLQNFYLQSWRQRWLAKIIEVPIAAVIGILASAWPFLYTEKITADVSG